MTEGMAWKRLARRGERPADDARATAFLLTHYDALASRTAALAGWRFAASANDLDGEDLLAVARAALAKALGSWDPALSAFQTHAITQMRFALRHAVRDASPCPDHEWNARAALLKGGETARQAREVLSPAMLAVAACPPRRFARFSEVAARPADSFAGESGSGWREDTARSVCGEPSTTFSDPALLYQCWAEGERLRAAVDRLPAHSRAFVEAYYYDGESGPAISARRGVCPSATYKARDRALRLLRGLLADPEQSAAPTV